MSNIKGLILELNKKAHTDKSRWIAALLSIFIHLLLLILFGLAPDIKPDDKFQATPLSQIEPKEKRLTFELIETPDQQQKLPSKPTDLASDKSFSEQDTNPDTELKTGLPFAEGEIDAKSFQIPPETVADKQDNQNPDSNTDPQTESSPSDVFYTSLLEKKKQALLQKETDPVPAYNNTESSSPEFGNFSFNTYKWDYAPYMLMMKKKIRQNMVLPYAFTHLGAISGEVIVFFSVLPSGVVNRMEVINSDAHYSLENSSLNAIKSSSAFDPLPRNFPEEKLEVKVRFVYFVSKRK